MYQVGCKNCPFKTRRVGARGNPRAPIVLLGQSPGRQELSKGVPFVGPSGAVLWHCAPGHEEKMGFDLHDECFITNAMCCIPPERDEEGEEIAEGDIQKLLRPALMACHNRMMEEITLFPRKIIIAMGNPAVWSITGNYTSKIMSIRGKIIPAPLLAEHGIMPTMHPAALLRGNGSFRKFKEDIRYAFQIARTGKYKEWIDPAIKVCSTYADVWVAVEDILQYKEAGADVETTGFNPRHDKLLCLGIAVRPDLVYVFPAHVVSLLRRLFSLARSRGRPRFVWHNGKFDIKFLRQPPYELDVYTDEDTMLMSYALDEIPGLHDLEQVGNDFVGAPDWKHMIKPYIRKKSDHYGLIPKPVLYNYMAKDVSTTIQIRTTAKPLLEQDVRAHKLYTRTLIPASEMLTEVESNGIFTAQGQIAVNKWRLERKIAKTVAAIRELAGWNINPASPDQVATLLFDQLKFETKDRSTDKEALEDLDKKYEGHPVIKAMRTFRKEAKEKTSYVDNLIKAVEPDRRAYATSLIHGSKTGRLAFRKPALQTIPRVPYIRAQYRAPKKRVLIEVDLNQAELRSLAALSGDPEMCRIYSTPNMSIHDEIRAQIWGYPKDWTDSKWAEYMNKFSCTRDRVEAEQKMRAKALNFGIVYGREAYSVSEEFKITVQEAQLWIDAWFARFPEAKKFIDRCRAAAFHGQTLWTTFGRQKRHGIVTRERIKDLMNEASNFPHQSIASDITLHAAIKIYKLLREYGAMLVLLIHDSLLVEAPANDNSIQGVINLMVTSMESIAPEWGITRIPFLAEPKVGERWGYLKEYHKKEGIYVPKPKKAA